MRMIERLSIVVGLAAIAASVCAAASTLSYLQQKSDQFQTRYYVYQCADCAGNHFPARGEFDDASANKAPTMDEIKVPTMDEISSGVNCIEITCITARFDPLKAVWGGWYFMNGVLGATDRTPIPNWGTQPNAGLSLQGATTLHFWARGKRGGEVITFLVGGVGYDPDSGTQVASYPDSSHRLAITKTLTSTWTEYQIPLAGADLSYVLGGFGWVAAAANQKDSSLLEFYLDDIYYDLARPTDPRLLVSFETLNSGQSFDMVLRNAAFLYDSSLAVFAFLGAADLAHARATGDAILYGQNNDRFFTDRRIRNAYQGGDIVLPAGWVPNGKLNTVRMPGWYDTAHSVWYEDDTQVSTNTGNAAWTGLALMGLWEVTKDPKYLDGARALGDWVLNNTTDTRGGDPRNLGGFTGGDDGWEMIAAASGTVSQCASHTLSNGQCVRGYKSVEHNVDLLSLFSRLYAADGNSKWANGAANARHFVASMWNNDHFRTGTLEDGYTPSEDVVPTDIQAWALLAFGTEAQPYLASLDYLDTHNKTSLGYGFKQSGGNVCGDSTWFEGSSQVGLANLLFGRTTKANSILTNIHSVQKSSGGVPATDGQCLSTGFNLNDNTPWEYYPRLHVGATSWLWLFENGYNPYRPEIYQPVLSPANSDFGQVSAGNSVSRTFTLTNPGPAQLTLSKVTLSGAAAADFHLVTTCADTLSPKTSCTATVTFNGGSPGGVAELDVVEVSDSAMLPVTLSAALSASSSIATATYTLSVSLDPPAGGTVSVAPQAASYQAGTMVCLKTASAPGWTFAGWSGDIPDASGCFVMNANKIVTARFTSPFKITQLSVPNWGANPATIRGTLSGPSFADYKIAVFVFLTGQGWFSKPTCAQTTVPVSPSDGAFSALITTGGTDSASTEIALVVVPASYTAACYSNAAGLPAEVLQNAVAQLIIHRPNPAEREVRFSGQAWGVKASTVPIGPGGCVFSDSTDNVFVDSGGSLHLRLVNTGVMWTCAEVYSRAATGYGVYTWTLPALPANDAPVVFGSYSWEDAVQNSKEIDVEVGFQQPNDSTTGQFVVQPFNTPGNLKRIALPSSVPITFRITWLPGQLLFQAFSGVDTQGTKITEWQYAGTVPSALGNYLNFRFNLWLNNGLPSSSARQEAVISNYSWQPFYPDGSGPYIDVVANVADYAPRAAPGEPVAVFGRGFSQTSETAVSPLLPSSLAGASVSVNGLPAPLYYAGSGQINLQLPYEIGPGSALINISSNGNTGPSFAFPVTPAAPAAFLSTSGACLAQNQDFTLNSAAIPAKPGSTLILYATGIGAVDNPVSTGSPAPPSPLSRPSLPSSAQIDGTSAELQFLGLIPGLVGVAQANVKVPDSIAAGSHGLTISVGSFSSRSCPFYTSGVAAAAPKITAVSPMSGPNGGGTPVTITGTSFQPGATVFFGAVMSSTVTFTSAFSLNAISPPGSGKADIKVVNPDGQNTVAPMAFTYDIGTVSLKGTVYDVNNAGLGGVLVTVTGTHPATATTGADGSFLIPGFLTTDTYTLTPSRAGYTFNPAQASGTVGNGVTLSFLGNLNTFTVSGHATLQPSGGPAAGVTVSISGPRNDSSITAADGSYQFTGFNYNDSVNITAAKTGYIVSPGLNSIRITTNTTVDIQVSQPSINGRVYDANNTGVSGVLITVTGAHAATATTATDGSFAIPGFLTTDTYTAAPSKTGYTFTPTQATGTVGNGATLSFIGSLAKFTLSGHATLQPAGGPAVGVTVSISGPRNDSAITAADGSYQFTGLNYNDSVNITAAKTGYIVNPGSSSVRISNNTIVDIQVVQPSLGGRVYDASNVGIAGVLITVIGTHPTTTTTAADGSFSISGFLTTDTYTATPSKTGYTFTPTQATGTVGNGPTLSFVGVSKPAPTIASVLPSQGPVSGGTGITVTGTGFLAGATVSVGVVNATNVVVTSSTTITAQTGAASSTGSVTVTVTNPDGKSASLPNAFSYRASPPVVSSISPLFGPATGGTPVMVTGTGFVTGATVAFGSSIGTVSQLSSTQIRVTTPPGSSTVAVTVTNPDQQAGTLPNAFSYIAVSNPSIRASIQGGTISGSVSGVTPPQAFRVAAYAYTNAYYVQPCVTNPISAISPNGVSARYKHITAQSMCCL